MTVIPLFLYVRGVEIIGLGPTGMIFYITPTLQFILGYFYYGEDFSLVKFVSFIIIWIAVIIYIMIFMNNIKIFFYIFFYFQMLLQMKILSLKNGKKTSNKEPYQIIFQKKH